MVQSLNRHPFKIFAGNANRPLAEAIAERLGTKLGSAEVKRFSDGEVCVTTNESVRGCDVFIVQSTSKPVNDHLMELLIMIDAFKRASAGRITAVIPYFGYARQDRKARARDPISAKLVADLMTAAGTDRVLTMDLHADQIQGFFNIPVDHLQAAPVLAEYYREQLRVIGNENFVVVSPDAGSVARARKFTEKLGEVSLAIVDKRRPRPNVSEVMNIIGEVKGKHCLLLDDMADTAGTLCHAAEALVKNGAASVSAAASHGVLSGKAMENIAASPIREFVVTDSIDIPEEKRIEKLKILSIAPVFAEAIGRVYEDLSVSTLFN
ncbi:MAG: ribose-phosphate pyrophosphokinase [Clostridia bacterium]|nr:ribose-phosphate pyrophosphokinase [Clostridia bacterium]MBQ6000401.1 ribose-phosphate pyrophosphokinase [Clostridia bacterium]